MYLFKRFSPWFCEPVVAGLTENGKPYMCGMDLIGCAEVVEDYLVSGTCTSNLHGMCESLYKPDMVRYTIEKKEFFEIICLYYSYLGTRRAF